MSNTYIAKWSDGTITILNSSNEIELFSELDEEGDPLSAEVYVLPKRFIITTDLFHGSIKFYETFKDNKLKRFKFSKNIFEKVYKI